MSELHPLVQWLFLMAAFCVPVILVVVTVNGDRLYRMERRKDAEIADLREKIARVVEHRDYWQRTRRHVPEGWTASSASAYRMAMDYVVDELLEVEHD